MSSVSSEIHSKSHTEDNSRSIKLWWDFIKEHKWFYVAGFLTVMLTNAMQVYSTRIIGWILDFFSGAQIPKIFSMSSKKETFYVLLGSMIVSRLILFLGRYGWRRTLARQTHHASAVLKGNVWNKARFFSFEDLQTKYTKGPLMSASTSDVGTARFAFGFTLVAVCDVVFLGLFTTYAMVAIHPMLTFWSFVVLLFLPFVIKKLSELEIERYDKAQSFLAEFNDLTSQVVSSIRLQRLTQTGTYWKKRLFESADNYRQIRLKAVNTSLMYIPLMGGTSLVCYIFLFALGIYYVFQGELSVGDFVAIQGLLMLLQDPLLEIGFIISEFRKSFTSLNRLIEIYDHPNVDYLYNEGESAKDSNEVISVNNLSFSYPSNQNKVFENFNLDIKKGERIGITGKIGSGKSTLVSILTGLERNVQGEVKFLGKSFDYFTHNSLRNYMALVPQKAFLFADSIKRNISMNLDLTDAEVWKYLEIAGLKDDVESFPGGIDTQLGEWGINLSGGQKQRLTLARALARRPKLLCLDDCLSAVDTVTEERILENINEELKDMTIIWVAHRESTLRHCDRIINMDEY